MKTLPTWILVFAIALISPIWGGEGKYATVEYIVGEAEILRADGTKQRVRMGVEMSEGDTLRTGENSQVILRLSDGTRVRVTAGSSLSFGSIVEKGRTPIYTFALPPSAILIGGLLLLIYIIRRPKTAGDHIKWARRYMEDGKGGRAIRHYKRALSKVLDDDKLIADIHADLGYIYIAQNNPQEAEYHWRKALEHDPTRTELKRITLEKLAKGVKIVSRDTDRGEKKKS
ncbi:MAG: tetratricopeptide repeat protein [bacterium]